MISIALELGLRKRENNIFTIRKTMTKLENKQNIYISEIALVRDLLGDGLANDLIRFVKLSGRGLFYDKSISSVKLHGAG